MPLLSFAFLLAFLPAAVIVWPLAPARARPWALLLLNLAFYSFAGAPALVVLASLTAIAFLTGRGLERGRRRQLWLAAATTILVILCFFKLGPSLGRWLPPPDAAPVASLVIPLGLSFYTLNLLGYCLDVHWGRIEAEPSALRFAAYASFFPTITSGPLVRYEAFCREPAASPELVALRDRGLLLLIMGIAKKVFVADPLGAAVDPLFASSELSLWLGWAAVLGYHFQVYFDFSGYTDIALGAGALLGFRLPPNFRAPYAARSITEFWQRWHMSLSFWFRDYVFMPLAFSLRRRSGRPGLARSVALVVTMLLVGLWHAPSWSYAVWGSSQGVVLASHAALRSAGRRPWPAWLGRLATTLALLAGWVVLRSPDLRSAGAVFRALLGLNGGGGATAALGRLGAPFVITVVVLLVVTNLQWDSGDLAPRRGWLYLAAATLLAVLAIMSLGKPPEFIYMRF